MYDILDQHYNNLKKYSLKLSIPIELASENVYVNITFTCVFSNNFKTDLSFTSWQSIHQNDKLHVWDNIYYNNL